MYDKQEKKKKKKIVLILVVLVTIFAPAISRGMTTVLRHSHLLVPDVPYDVTHTRVHVFISQYYTQICRALRAGRCRLRPGLSVHPTVCEVLSHR